MKAKIPSPCEGEGQGGGGIGFWPPSPVYFFASTTVALVMVTGVAGTF